MDCIISTSICLLLVFYCYASYYAIVLQDTMYFIERNLANVYICDSILSRESLKQTDTAHVWAFFLIWKKEPTVYLSSCLVSFLSGKKELLTTVLLAFRAALATTDTVVKLGSNVFSKAASCSSSFCVENHLCVFFFFSFSHFWMYYITITTYLFLWKRKYFYGGFGCWMYTYPDMDPDYYMLTNLTLLCATWWRRVLSFTI